MINGFKDLKVYQQAYQLSLEIHRLSLTFPQYEQYELGGQIRRATKSIALNIAEGYGKRQSSAEFKRHIIMAVGSCDEVKAQLDYIHDLGYLNTEQYEAYQKGYAEVGKMLYGLHQKWQ